MVPGLEQSMTRCCIKRETAQGPLLLLENAQRMCKNSDSKLEGNVKNELRKGFFFTLQIKRWWLLFCRHIHVYFSSGRFICLLCFVPILPHMFPETQATDSEGLIEMGYSVKRFMLANQARGTVASHLSIAITLNVGIK